MTFVIRHFKCIYFAVGAKMREVRLGPFSHFSTFESLAKKFPFVLIFDSKVDSIKKLSFRFLFIIFTEKNLNSQGDSNMKIENLKKLRIFTFFATFNSRQNVHISCQIKLISHVQSRMRMFLIM